MERGLTQKMGISAGLPLRWKDRSPFGVGLLPEGKASPGQARSWGNLLRALLPRPQLRWRSLPRGSAQKRPVGGPRCWVGRQRGAGTGEHLQEADAAGGDSRRTICAQSLSSSGADVPTFRSRR